ncbi:MAG: methyltransferase domain-containing protein [Acidimicrobiia bacterium]|nr:MAG: methyltransferase domain-containing protein [Acidimicrobiia bacterium]
MTSSVPVVASAFLETLANTMKDRYTHGHHASVVAHHATRTVENSAAFLIPHLVAGARLLDVGCGPGSVTRGFVSLVEPGDVVGVDVSPDVIEIAARETQAAGVENVEFRVGDVYALPFEDAEFDVVYAHQVLQHLTEPVVALTEMRRVVRSGGVVGVRDADYGAFVWTPEHPALTRWLEIYHRVTEHNGAQADAGRHLVRWFHKAGFDETVVSTSNWHYADPAARRWWGEGWAVRALESSFAHQAVEYGYCTRDDLKEISEAFRWWSVQDDAFFLVPHVEVVAFR